MIPRSIIRRFRRRMRESKPWARRAFFAFGISLLHLFVFESALGAAVEPVLMDALFRVRGAVAPPDDVVIVSIDEKTYRELGLSTIEPIPRRLYGDILRRLRDYGAGAVFLDFIFRSPGSDAEGDAIFAEALRSVPTYLGKYVRYTRHTALDGRRVEQEEWVLPLERLAVHAAGVIPLNLWLDGRTVRRFYFPTTPHPVTSTAMIVCGKTADCPRLPGPTDYINFYGPPGTLKRISLADLLGPDAGEIGNLLRGKVIFLGNETLTQVGIENRDAFLTPFAEGMTFGVEIHATAAGNLLDQNWIRRLDPRLEITALNISIFLTAFLSFGMRPGMSLLVLLAVGTAWLALSFFLFHLGIFLPGVFFLSVILPGIFLLSTLYHSFVYKKSFQRFRKALGVDVPLHE